MLIDCTWNSNSPAARKKKIDFKDDIGKVGWSPASSLLPYRSVEDATFKRNKTASLTFHLTARRITPDDAAYTWRQNVEKRFKP